MQREKTGTGLFHDPGVRQCEKHPGTIWPHGECAGPGMPLYDEADPDRVALVFSLDEISTLRGLLSREFRDRRSFELFLSESHGRPWESPNEGERSAAARELYERVERAWESSMRLLHPGYEPPRPATYAVVTGPEGE